MRRLTIQISFLLLLAFGATAQPSLDFFTNKASALLQAVYGFGVTNIPIYSPTDTNVGYTSSIHYLLQSAANLYDAGTPATNFPSVFRPLFGWNSNTLEIVGYTNVTTGFFPQISSGFKALGDSTITTNDNVWGIPWVVGMKNDPPAFSGFAYLTEVLAERQLLFQRATNANGAPNTNIPPQYTNQFFIMTISNSFGLKAWNFNRSAYTNPVTILVTNQIFVTLTNNYNWGSVYSVSIGTNEPIDSWQGWSGSQSDGSFLVPIITNITALPQSYWSENQRTMIALPEGVAASNGFSATDLYQTGWPVHQWTVAVTNNLVYALVDDNSGAVLDFVNLGGFGKLFPITTLLQNAPPGGVFGGGGVPSGDYWEIGAATEAPNSPISTGVLYQIQQSLTNQYFLSALRGVPYSAANAPDYPGPLFGCPFQANISILQTCKWASANPRVHYTISDLANVLNNLFEYSAPSPFALTPSSYAGINTYYNSGAPTAEMALPDGAALQLTFTGSTNMPYVVWESPDLINWTPTAVAMQVRPTFGLSSFQFSAMINTNLPALFYQIRQP